MRSGANRGCFEEIGKTPYTLLVVLSQVTVRELPVEWRGKISIFRLEILMRGVGRQQEGAKYSGNVY